jgi:hypothetical protein
MEKCENCRTSIGALETPHLWCNRVVCAACYRRLSDDVPMPSGPKGAGHPAPLLVGGASLSGITTPLLVSAIGNIVFGAIWATTCFGIILTVAMAILSIFELRLYAKADTLPPLMLAEKASSISQYQIFVGLFNLVSLVCGIVLSIHARKLRERSVG